MSFLDHHRAPCWLLLLGLVAAPLFGLGCEETTSIEITRFEVSPSGAVARCQDVGVIFAASDRARYALTSGGVAIAAGIMDGLDEEVHFSADRLPTTSSQLRLSVAAAGVETSRTVELALDASNSAPVARPRLGGAPTPGTMLRLQGDLSDDPDGDAITQVWNMITLGSDAVLQDSTMQNALLQLPAGPTSVDVELIVRDTHGASDSVVVHIVSAPEGNSPPVFQEPTPTEALRVAASEAVRFEVVAEDPDGDALQYTFRQTAGPALELGIDPGGTAVQLDAPDRPTLVAIEVTASDGGHTTRTRVDLAVDGAEPDLPPIPAAELLSEAFVYSTVRLSGATTTDPDSSDLWYEWSVLLAPPDSLVGTDSLTQREGVGADTVSFVPDLPGLYRFKLRVADGLGFAPTAAIVDVHAQLEADNIHSNPVAQVVCRDNLVAWAGSTGVGMAQSGFILGTVTTSPVDAIQFLRSGNEVWVGTSGSGTVRLSVGTNLGIDDTRTVELPSGAGEINGIVVDPAPTRNGDVYVGTNGGTAILDVSESDCDDPSPVGCWVGSTSTGYLHAPPSMAGQPSDAVHELYVSVGADGRTLVELGNEFWLARLDRGDGDHDFTHALADLFDDRLPQAITALEATSDHLYVGAQPYGLVRREESFDCGFNTSAPRECERLALEACTFAATLDAPAFVSDLAAWDEALFIASTEGFRYYTPELSRYSTVVPAGDEVTGNPTAVAVCNDTLYLGTNEGLWQVALGGDV